ncbi:Na+-transporting NADH:ubiquinone oxidoreductase subunit C [Microbulbifer donghaiensis]|uniref:Na(+)-translocating NADH-quinone reductase subunit C n=1 Tax=Microbulbifer donghaiensis TaxID=494016 RepID=A0A1M4W453_9GAMM|nr:Na(+)-translocating NADH-quinone reductase subunit C [Microbulbifer donghaiensis]SHE75930.1 Na+-transporting NADH:ubiquinone oxidoreductase subunit C [Microbulbifer donghaiensis]
MVNKDSVRGTLLVALVMCLVCSVVVATAAVLLRPAQQANVELDRKRNVLVAGGLVESGASAKEVNEAFQTVTTRYVDLTTGKFTEEMPAGGSGRAASRIKGAHERLARSDDIAKIFRRENVSEVYLVEENGKLNRLILPVRGSGLWGTLFGFLALESDLNTVAGLAFYEHRETPGLGGEVDNPNWKALWHGRKVFDADGDVAISVVKGSVDPNSPQAIHQVDGLSGATLTSNGVENLLRFWLGAKGFGPFLKNLKAGEA